MSKINLKQAVTFLILVMMVFVFGCSMKTTKKIEFNPVVYDNAFRNALLMKPITFVAPASSAEPPVIEKLRSTQLLDIPDDWYVDGYVYHSNSDEARFQFLKKALLSPNKDSVIWALRGGYGSARLIENLKKVEKPKVEKIFIGYSDITALHLFLSQEWGWKSIHGSTLSELVSKKDPNNFKKIAAIIQKQVTQTELTDLKPLNKLAEKNKAIKGPLTGGNLTIIETSLGTDWQIKAEDKILFLEEHKEPPYKLDRALTHLEQAGVFKNVKAIILGNFDNDDENGEYPIERFAQSINVPVFKSNQFGHGTTNYPLIYNANSKIIFDKNDLNHHLIMDLN